MNKMQSTDFNAGMLYEQIERDTHNLIRDYKERKRTENTNLYSFPKIQLFPEIECDIKGKTIVDDIKHTVMTQFNRVYSKNYELSFNNDYPSGSYYIFCYTIKRKEDIKEMTIAEIEEKLGYKIKVVGE